MDANTANGPHVESTILEVDTVGRVLNTWDLSAIFRQTMTDAGDVANMNTFVRNGDDWFHSNAAAYWRDKDTLVVSSRENFVVGVGYTDKKIKWILGDPEKFWYTCPSLRALALTLAPSTRPPIGQHSVSITANGDLLLFDNGLGSFNQASGVYLSCVKQVHRCTYLLVLTFRGTQALV